MAKRQLKYSKETVLKAINGSGGIVSTVAKRLNCDWGTARNYINRWKATQDAFAAEREMILDIAETTIIDAIKGGDVGTAKWVLSRLGIDRGYGNDVNISADDGKIRVVLTWGDAEND